MRVQENTSTAEGACCPCTLACPCCPWLYYPRGPPPRGTPPEPATTGSPTSLHHTHTSAPHHLPTHSTHHTAPTCTMSQMRSFQVGFSVFFTTLVFSTCGGRGGGAVGWAGAARKAVGQAGRQAGGRPGRGAGADKGRPAHPPRTAPRCVPHSVLHTRTAACLGSTIVHISRKASAAAAGGGGVGWAGGSEGVWGTQVPGGQVARAGTVWATVRGGEPHRQNADTPPPP